jgi:hypothetical protein
LRVLVAAKSSGWRNWSAFKPMSGMFNILVSWSLGSWQLTVVIYYWLLVICYLSVFITNNQ